MIQIKQLTKTFKNTKGLDNINATVESGEMVALIGSSGSGKSTLMRHISGLMCGDADSGGQIEVLSHIMQRDGRLSRNARQVRTEVGVIFQQFNLVDRLSVMTNVLMGALGRVPTWRAVSNLFPPWSAAWAWNPWPASAWPTRPGSGPRPCPAASSSAWPSPAP
jgi:phosphonate transport system ATP-binding protein